MCATCNCGDVNNVMIPGNKSGIGGSQEIAKQSSVKRDSDTPAHERSESKDEQMREYGYIKRK